VWRGFGCTPVERTVQHQKMIPRLQEEILMLYLFMITAALSGIPWSLFQHIFAPITNFVEGHCTVINKG